jgi:hypothetical protein
MARTKTGNASRAGDMRRRAEEQAVGGTLKNRREMVEQAGIYEGGSIERLRIRAYYPPTRRLYDVTDRLLTLSWSDAVDQAAVQATVELADFDSKIGDLMNRPGMTIFVETKAKRRKFEERLRMIAMDTSYADGVVTLECYDHLLFLELAKGTFTYKKDKDHPKGWTCDQIAIDIFTTWGVPIAVSKPIERNKGEGRKKGDDEAKGGGRLQIVKGKYPIPYFHVPNASLYETVAKAYMIERKESGKHYYIESVGGRVCIRRSRSRRTLLAITNDTLQSASFSRSLIDNYGTIAKISGGDRDDDGKRTSRNDPQGKGDERATDSDEEQKKETKRKKGKKDKQAESERRAIASGLLFGDIRYRGRIPTVRDKNWTLKASKALVQQTARAKKEFTLTCAGNVLLKQGDRVLVRYPIGQSKLEKALFVNAVTHNFNAGIYTMDVTLSWREREVDLEMELTGEETQQGGGTKSGGAGGGGGNTQGGGETTGASWYGPTPSTVGAAGVDLRGKMAFAELSNDAGMDFSALGGLPMHAKIAITYKGKTVVGEKLDVGSGGGSVQGYPRTIDLWVDLADALGFDKSAGIDVVQWRRM